MQSSSAVKQKRYGTSEVAVISEAVWAQGSWRRHTGSAITIPNTLAQEMQYAAHIGMPSGLCSVEPGFGIQTRRTGAVVPSRVRDCARARRWGGVKDLNLYTP